MKFKAIILFLLFFSSIAQAVETKTILCVATIFDNHRNRPCGALAARAASVYTQNANGKAFFRGTGRTFRFKGKYSSANFNKAAAQIRSKYIKRFPHIIVLATRRGGSSIGAGVVRLGQRLYSVSTHEVGHRLKLGHSSVLGKPLNPKKKRITDKDTPMANNSSSSRYLLPSQLHKLKWLDPVEHKTITAIDENETFEIVKTTFFTKTLAYKKLKLVRIPPCVMYKGEAGCESEKMLAISYPISCNDCVAVYFNYTYRGFHKTQRIASVQLGTASTMVWEDLKYTGLKLKLTKVPGSKTVKVNILK